MHTSLSAARLASLAVTMLVTIALFGFARTSHAQTGFGQIQRINVALATQTQAPLPSAPANVAELGPELPVPLQTVYTKAKPINGTLMTVKQVKLDCSSGQLQRCSVMATAIRSLGFEHERRPAKRSTVTCTVTERNGTVCAGSDEDLMRNITRAAIDIAKARAEAAKKN